MKITAAAAENNKQLALFTIRQVLKDNCLATFGPVEVETLRAEVGTRLQHRGWSISEVRRAYKDACAELLPKEAK